MIRAILRLSVLPILEEIWWRVSALLFYPIAYYNRDKIRKKMYEADLFLVEERTWKDTRDLPVNDFYNKAGYFTFFLWLYLDDSPAKDSFYNGKPSYDSSDTRRYYPAQWIYDNKTLRDIWFSGIRNCAVNYKSWTRTGGWVKPTKVYLGKFDEEIDKNDDNSYYYEGLYLADILHKNGKVYPYYTYVGNFVGRKTGVWLGRSSGSGRFSMSVRM